VRAEVALNRVKDEITFLTFSRMWTSRLVSLKSLITRGIRLHSCSMYSIKNKLLAESELSTEKYARSQDAHLICD
jgi:hypothetical protein